ncbi:UNVERIFIED_CONTAM: hypothetical protein IGO34_25360, partial [Salmonella enterica subsp. enterica serovar Weltevreden]
MTENGVLYEYNQLTGTHTKKQFLDSLGLNRPIGTLIQASNNKIYGSTFFGGTYGYGTLFEFDHLTNTLIKRADFNEIPTGKNPLGVTQAQNGKLYGCTGLGGLYGCGVLYEYDIASNA